MLFATVPYVGKRLHLDPEPDPDPKLNYGSGSEHANNFWSGRIRIHNPAYRYLFSWNQFITGNAMISFLFKRTIVLIEVKTNSPL
jgi:hypothetical protein